MDGLAWIVVAFLAMAALMRALVPGLAPSMQAHVAALGQLFGGWRPPAWPRGVQEDDPETAWANHGQTRAAPRVDDKVATDSTAAVTIEDLD